MVNLLIRNGRVLTMNDERDVIADGAVAIDGDQIVEVGETSELDSSYDADRTIDATDHAVVPGLINAHNHVSDILFRGGVSSDRSLYDWIFNVKFPGVTAMTAEEHEVASALFSAEAIRSGITTFVENAVGGGGGYPNPVIEAKFRAYERAGHRVAYAQSFIDVSPDEEFLSFADDQMMKEPSVDHGSLEEEVTETDAALEELRSLIESHHGAADGRLSVWPGPVLPDTTTEDGLRGAVEIAEEHDVMTTTHVSETEHDEQDFLTSVEYLNNVGYLGSRTLLGHCVHLTRRDIQLLAQTDTRVSHNPLTNLALGAGFAPVPEMINYGVTTGIGTDNSSASDTVNMINDVRFAALIHNANHQDAAAMTAEKALEMATIDGARAIGREDDLGSLESGKKADVVLVDLDHDHLTPSPNVASVLVNQAQGFEVETVICNGEVIMSDGTVHGIGDEYPSLRERAEETAEDVAERIGLSDLRDRPWTSISDI